jgi:hypothetical protein
MLRTSARLSLAFALLLTLAGCGDDASTVTTEQPASAPSASAISPSPAATAGSPAASPTPAEPTADNTFEIGFADGKATGDTGRLEVALNDSVAITVTSTQADEVHVHGYDLTAPVGPGQPAVIEFDATIPGVFEIELEDLGTQLAALQVQ